MQTRSNKSHIRTHYAYLIAALVFFSLVFFQHVYICLSLPPCLCLRFSVCLSDFLSISLLVSICPSISLYNCRSVYLSVCLTLPLPPPLSLSLCLSLSLSLFSLFHPYPKIPVRTGNRFIGQYQISYSSLP